MGLLRLGDFEAVRPPDYRLETLVISFICHFPTACCHLAAIAKDNKRHKADRVLGVAKGRALPISAKVSLRRFKPPLLPLFTVFIFVPTRRRRTRSHSPDLRALIQAVKPPTPISNHR